ncbi:hypothetical protein PG999_000002 [Apiospora kogelbergensis]|uniref:Ankyrin repeat-containing protein n=1 Tax=Apiospora kogelbergensis TaxID=1337665 RepID=A0AAW0RAM3_9PEZI
MLFSSRDFEYSLCAVAIDTTERRRLRNRLAKRKSRSEVKRKQLERPADNPSVTVVLDDTSSAAAPTSSVARTHRPHLAHQSPMGDQRTRDMASEVTTTQYLTQQNQEQPYLGSASDQTNVYAVEQMETGNTRCYTSRTFQRYPTSYTRAEDLPRFDVAATSILPTNNDLTQAASAPPVPAVATQEDDLFNLFNDNSKPHKLHRPMGGTPLHIAAALGHLSTVKILIVYGADINAVDDARLTPAHYAALNNHGAVLSTLLENGANSNGVDPEGYTLLYKAAENGYDDVVERLLRHGVCME